MNKLTEQELAKLVMQWAMMTMEVKPEDKGLDSALSEDKLPQFQSHQQLNGQHCKFTNRYHQ